MIIFLFSVLYYFSLPEHLFNDPFATIIEDNKGNLLEAKIAGDGQWRFPPSPDIPEKLEKSVLLFEDQYFYFHPGFNPFSLARAFYQNLQAGEIVSGGSTISMQVIRLFRKQKPRTYIEKFIEILLSVRLELACSKREILAMYISHAPYGSNVVGVQAAAWRYFGRNFYDLSWGEAALLAVLPNQPGLIYPGKNHDQLKIKRDKLLDRLMNKGEIDRLTCMLSCREPVPASPNPLPSLAPHLMTRALKEGKKGERIISTLDLYTQQSAVSTVEKHAVNFRSRQINNAAAIILNINSGKVLAYIGNVMPGNLNDDEHGNSVDIIMAPRSTGSILKPFLYAAMIDEGKILPGMLIPDIPTIIDGFSPKNFSKTYDGAVPAFEVVARSLNVPAVHMLKEYRYEKFHYILKKFGMTTLTQPPGHYGLSLILGGAEATLWDLCGIYASFGRTLNGFFKLPAPNRYVSEPMSPPIVFYPDTIAFPGHGVSPYGTISAAAIWLTFNIMTEASRPEEDISWKYFSSGRKIAWKTGTSFGHRDAWAIGLDNEYLVGVWVGNADGEGRPGLTGIDYAAPLMFDLFNIMPVAGWFNKPGSELYTVKVCGKSGFRASINCAQTRSIEVPQTGTRAEICPYCFQVFLDPTGKFRVNDECEDVFLMKSGYWFVLPPVQEWYYKSRDPFYTPLPPYRDDCKSGELSIPSMAMIYPKNNARIYIPTELSGQSGQTIFEAAHRIPGITIYWHVDNQFIGMTRNFHQMGINSGEGSHMLTLVDEKGETLKIQFKIISGG